MPAKIGSEKRKKGVLDNMQIHIKVVRLPHNVDLCKLMLFIMLEINAKGGRVCQCGQGVSLS